MDGVAGGGPALLPLPCDTTLQLLLRISTHIERAPLDPKYRRLNTSAGSKFHSLVWRHPAGRQLFAETGWVESDTEHIAIPRRGNTALLRFLVLELLSPELGGLPESGRSTMAPVPTARAVRGPAPALVSALVRRLARHERGLFDRVVALAWDLSTGAILELLRTKVSSARAQAGSLIMVRGHNAQVDIRRVAMVRCHDHPIASAADRHHFPAMAGPFREWVCNVCFRQSGANAATRNRCVDGCDFDICPGCVDGFREDCSRVNPDPFGIGITNAVEQASFCRR